MNEKKAIREALYGLGYTVWDYSNPKDWSKPSVTVQEQLNAICEHLGIFIVKNPSAIVIEERKESSLPKRGKK